MVNADDQTHPTMEWTAVIRREELSPGKVHAVKAHGAAYALTLIDDELHAVAGRCPHRDAPMTAGRIVAGHEIACPWHGFRFDLSSGAAVMPCEHSPDIESFQTRVVDGSVQLLVPVSAPT